ncbi:MAG: replication-associated recombination protein A [Alphaproteobacteria bacterium GM202ARS2]|nr:replication-associated recombination protein A [Alphaproteobacteria bacterium GM202ARS2]
MGAPPVGSTTAGSPPVRAPLAERLRPRRFEDLYGQEHLFDEQGEGSFIRQLTQSPAESMSSSEMASLILWGPPGCGKTTLARLIAEKSQHTVMVVSAVASGTSELRVLFKESQKRKQQGQGSILFIDEIHRFNRAQQDLFLPYIEDGTIVLLGSTTENPSFELNGALLSRCHVMRLKALSDDALLRVLARAEKETATPLPLAQEDRHKLIRLCSGDARVLLNRLAVLYAYNESRKDKGVMAWEDVERLVHKHLPLHDKDRDAHYNLASVLHKSLRASDVDAALYWLARTLHAGEDASFVARRLTRFASEDIGLADPHALGVALAAWDSYMRLGSPEGDLALAHAVIYLATAPKSNAAYRAWQDAERAAQDTPSLPPKMALLNAPTDMMKKMGYAKGYAYDHNHEHAFSGYDCFPQNMARRQFYQPAPRGFERDINKRLEWWQKQRQKKAKDHEN